MSAPRVVFEGSALTAGPATGVARAFLHALAAFARDRRCRLLLPRAGREHVADDLPRHGVDVVDAPAGSLRKQLQLPALLDRLGCDVLHVPVTAMPARARCPVLVTVHDVPWLHGLGRADGATLRHRAALHLAARRAAALVAPSRATADDVLRATGGHARPRLHVVAHGLGSLPPPAATDATGPLLVIGDERPRKNLARVVDAHQRARAAEPAVPPLQCIGPPRWLPEADKLRALREARGLLHLSLLEGFGLPVLEAMALGVPVLCSDRGALAELFGEAALTADPTDVAAMADAIARLCRDGALRARLRTAGLQRAAALPAAATAAAWDRIHHHLAHATSAAAFAGSVP